MALLIRTGDFLGPNYVRGLAEQKQSFTVESPFKATLPPFKGATTDRTVLYTMTVYGTGFSETEDGRYTGTVTRFTVEGSDGTRWDVFGYNAALNTVNTAAVDDNFVDNLLAPVDWTYVGNQFDDVFIGGAFGDSLFGFGGDDSFQGLAGNDTIYGGAGNDTLNGEDDDDVIYGGRDDDLIRGGDGSDSLLGQRGDDSIEGGGSADTIRGGSGNDTADGGDQGDMIFGGRGDDSLLGGDGADTVRGGSGDDFVSGDGNQDEVFGGRGNDTVQGGDGNDFIIGGRGNDILAGNLASEVVVDTNAIDTFIFEGRFGSDIITDFQKNFDTIRLLSVDDPNDVTITEVGCDTWINVLGPGSPSILVQDVTGLELNIDIFLGS